LGDAADTVTRASLCATLAFASSNPWALSDAEVFQLRKLARTMRANARCPRPTRVSTIALRWLCRPSVKVFGAFLSDPWEGNFAPHLCNKNALVDQGSSVFLNLFWEQQLLGSIRFSALSRKSRSSAFVKIP
jgi:hypothetical protein